MVSVRRSKVARPLVAIALVLGLASAATGCKLLNKEAPAPADAGVAVVAPVEDAGAAAEAVVDAAIAPITPTKVVAKDPDQVPTPIDDEKVVATITKATYKAELDRVEKDVDSEK